MTTPLEADRSWLIRSAKLTAHLFWLQHSQNLNLAWDGPVPRVGLVDRLEKLMSYIRE